MDLSLLPSSTPAAKGGRCLDGSMAGYYYKQGSVAGRFVISMQGGGGCADEQSCLSRAKTDLGSSKNWKKQQKGYQFLSTDCSANPGFCNATRVLVKYCTGDLHQGNHTAPTAASWGLIFDGHANFAAIIDDLKSAHGLGAATEVLLTGDSAGGVGTFANADYLADRLPQATVKAAPSAGWFNPAALPSDLPDIYPPSDWAHFAAGTHGNPTSENSTLPALVVDKLWGARGLLPASCVADQKPDQWWACHSIHKWYKYIKTPLFVIENQ
jgi:hypothetical protein